MKPLRHFLSCLFNLFLFNLKEIYTVFHFGFRSEVKGITLYKINIMIKICLTLDYFIVFTFSRGTNWQFSINCVELHCLTTE